MRLIFEFHWQNSDVVPRPTHCPYPDCRSTRLRFKQVVKKPVRDVGCEEVVAHRYTCLGCGRTFRVYPAEISRAHTSQRVQKVALLFYLMGLGYGTVARILDALGIYLCKSQIRDVVCHRLGAVQTVQRVFLFRRARACEPRSGVVALRYKEHWLNVRLRACNRGCWVIEVEGLSSEDARYLENKISPLAALVGAQVRAVGDVARVQASGQAVESIANVPYWGGGEL